MSIHPEKLRGLAWLRITLLIRSYRNKPLSIVITIIAMLFLLCAVTVLAGLLFHALTTSDWLAPTGQSEALYLLLTAILLLCLVMPLLSYTSNEGLDVTKLQLFPLTRLEITCGLLFSSLFGLGTIFQIILFGAIIAAWGLHSLALSLLALVTLLIFYIAVVSISQLFLTLFMNVLQNRRFRDLSIVLLALASSSCYFFNRLIVTASNQMNITQALNNANFSPYLQWLPSGIAASALRTARQGNWTASLGLLGLLVLITIVALYLWQIALERSLSGSESGASRQARQQARKIPTIPATVVEKTSTSPVQTGSSASSGSNVTKISTQSGTATTAQEKYISGQAILREQLQALVQKELICYWRDPLLKALVLRYIVSFVLIIFINISQTSNDRTNITLLTGLTLILTYFFMLNISLNTLGIERQSLTTLLLFPIERQRLLWGKNIATGILGFTAFLAILIFNVIISGQLSLLLPMALIGLSGIGITLGCGNLVSVYFPRYQPEMGRRSMAGAGNQVQVNNNFSALLATLITLPGMLILLAPNILSIIIPYILHQPLIWLASVPFSLIYGSALYMILTNISARRLLKREPEILAITTRE